MQTCDRDPGSLHSVFLHSDESGRHPLTVLLWNQLKEAELVASNAPVRGTDSRDDQLIKLAGRIGEQAMALHHILASEHFGETVGMAYPVRVARILLHIVATLLADPATRPILAQGIPNDFELDMSFLREAAPDLLRLGREAR